MLPAAWSRPGPTAPAVARASANAPLELLALEHDRDGDRFIVRGIVRNPTGAGIDGLAAVVSVFGRDGDAHHDRARASGCAHPGGWSGDAVCGDRARRGRRGSLSREFRHRRGHRAAPRLARTRRDGTAAMRTARTRGHCLRGARAGDRVSARAGQGEERQDRKGRSGFSVPERRRADQRDGDRVRCERPLRARAAAGRLPRLRGQPARSR